MRKTWLKTNRRKTLRAVNLVLISMLSACSMFSDTGGSSDQPFGATVTSNLETKTQRDALAAKKMALQPSAGFAGAVVADEPTAALIARNILERGGNAADAATALYFALSVTYPAAAGLGGGGVCLVRGGGKKIGDVESVSFLTRRPRNGGPFAIPGNVRGFAFLQAQHGNLPWSELVAPAERIVATGFPVSRATAHQFSDAYSAIDGSADLKTLYTHDGGIYQETDIYSRVDLASTLSRIRSRGIAGFYQGSTAHSLVAQSMAKGGALSLSDLSDYRPEVSPAQSIAAGDVAVELPPRRLGSGAFAAALWSNLGTASGATAIAAAGERTAVSLGAPAGATGDSDFGSTSFAVVDATGGAVSCAVTMNGVFGSGRAAEGTGIVFASTPEAPVRGLGSAFLVPVMVINPDTKGLYLAGAGAGAPKGGGAIESVVKAAIANGGDSAVAALDASPADARSPVNAIFCPDGLPAGSCSLNPNPKGDGVGFSAVSGGS